MATVDATRRPYHLCHVTRNVSTASPPAVLWADLKATVPTDPDDPAGALETESNLIVLHNFDGLPWLCAFPHLAATAGSTTAAAGYFYGFFPFDKDLNDPKFRRIPSDVDSTNFDDSVLGSVKNTLKADSTATAATATISGIWLMLRELNATLPAVVTFDNNISTDKDSTAGSTKRQISLTPRYIYTQGARQIVFLPTTALVGASVTKALLLGILHS